jgi:hypothetical protein
MPETVKTLSAKRDALQTRADALRKTDPTMAKYLNGKAGEMDSELEGVDPIQERDQNGFLQGEDPDHIAFNEAQARVAGQPTTLDDDTAKALSVSPTFQIALNNHVGNQMRQNWMQSLLPQNQNPQGAQTYDNSVTPSGAALAEIQKRKQTEAELRDLLSE